MIWVAIAVALVLWLAGLLAQLGPLVNLLLVAAAILLVAHVVNERDQRA
jgi:O-antigen ligase